MRLNVEVIFRDQLNSIRVIGSASPSKIAMIEEVNATNDYEEYKDYDEKIGTFNWQELMPVLIVYCVTFALGLCGNVLIILATYRHRKMQSVTNNLLASLATADLLLIVVCIPVKLVKLFSHTWTMGEFLCKSVHYMQNVSAICSVLTLTAISTERYYAILHPMRARYICTISQVRKVIAVTWILAFLLATPILFVQDHMVVEGEKRVAHWCWKNSKLSAVLKVHEVYMLLLVLVIPTFIMTYAYKRICSEIWKVIQLRSVMTSRDALSRNCIVDSERINLTNPGKLGALELPRDDSKTVRQVIHMLVAVVVLFAICWGPLLIENVLTAYGKLPREKTGVYKHLLTAFHLMAYFNSCINPIIYGFMSKSFRDSFRSALCCFSRRTRRQSIINTTNYSTRTSRSSSHIRNTSVR